MALTVIKMTLPGDLAGQTNGKLNSNLIVPVNQWGSLHHLAKNAWDALCFDAAARGMFLTFTFGGMYRTYQSQVDLFLRRYRRGHNAKSKSNKFWDGSWWHLVTGAVAARPGTSNHGWALAIDMAYDPDTTDGIFPDDATYIMSHAEWPWLRDNVTNYGFSFELQSEPWHVRYIAGDTIPQRVAEYLKGIGAGTTPVPTPTPPPTAPPTKEHSVEVVPVTVKMGSTGQSVRRLQSLLWAMFGQDITIDNNFGPQTEAAVKNVQRFFGLTADGICGPKTWGIILNMPPG